MDYLEIFSNSFLSNNCKKALKNYFGEYLNLVPNLYPNYKSRHDLKCISNQGLTFAKSFNWILSAKFSN